MNVEAIYKIRRRDRLANMDIVEILQDVFSTPLAVQELNGLKSGNYESNPEMQPLKNYSSNG